MPAHRKRITKICKYCNKPFETTPSSPKVYCNIDCRVADNWAQLRDPSKRVKFHCAECGKEKEDWAYRKPRFCSTKCAFRYAAKLPKPWQVNRVTLTCKLCGKEYTCPKAYYELRDSKYCSSKCRYKAKSLSMRGPDNLNYIDGSPIYYRGPTWGSQARAARKRDDYTCQVCGKNGKRDHVRIDVHHIIPYRQFGEDYESANQLSNLISLCNPCHRKVESGKVTLKQYS